jgi:hypothetical protein
MAKGCPGTVVDQTYKDQMAHKFREQRGALADPSPANPWQPALPDAPMQQSQPIEDLRQAGN